MKHQLFKLIYGYKLMGLLEGQRVVAVADVVKDMRKRAAEILADGFLEGARVLREYADSLEEAPGRRL